MADYDDKMLKLRQSLPQGSDDPLLKNIESSVAYPESDPETGVSELEGVAYPQSTRLTDKENKQLEALKKFAVDSDSAKDKKKSVAVPPETTETTATTHKRSNYAPTGRKKKTSSSTPTSRGPKSLNDYQTKQTDEYYSIAENVIPEDSYQDFTQNEEAQTSFGQSAALKSYLKKADTMDHETEMRTLPSGEEIEVVKFPDGSEYYQETDATGGDLSPGDILRLTPPKKKS
jgi:hypothetical protein